MAEPRKFCARFSLDATWAGAVTPAGPWGHTGPDDTRGREMRHRGLGLTAALAATLSITATAQADTATSVFAVSGGTPISCQTQPSGLRYCTGSTSTLQRSFDGAPVDVNVVLPAAPATGADGPYPLIGFFHGWGGAKYSPDSMASWAKLGYATFSMSDRGWGDSCGGTSSTRLPTSPTGTACAQEGYNHLLDTRYEVHDAQYLIGMLADQGLADPQRIGATGGSYGGGMSMALAALKDRVMTPSGALVQWTSPNRHLAMRIAAAAPEIPWTDLSYSLMPNGHYLDYAISPDDYGSRTGVMKASFVSGLFATGLAASNYAPPQYDPDADLYTWFAAVAGGEPYDSNPLTQSVLAEIQQHHSSYYIDHSEAPAPLLISNGFTDDLFPVDEALRYYNRTKAQYPDAYVGLYDLDYGHQRGQNKGVDVAALHARQQQFFDHFLLPAGDSAASLPPDGQTVQAALQVCGAPSGTASPVYSAATPAGLVPGEVRLNSDAAQVVASPGNPAEGQAFDPIAGGGACATTAEHDVPGVALYRIPVTGSGLTVLGAATIIASIRSPSPNDQIAARLVDVSPAGNETLVARGLYRPATSVLPTQQVFQLHPGAWHFAAGHTAMVELQTADAPYARPSNGQAAMTVERAEIRLPVAEQPDGGAIQAPAPKYVPSGFTLAGDWAPGQG